MQLTVSGGAEHVPKPHYPNSVTKIRDCPVKLLQMHFYPMTILKLPEVKKFENLDICWFVFRRVKFNCWILTDLQSIIYTE